LVTTSNLRNTGIVSSGCEYRPH